MKKMFTTYNLFISGRFRWFKYFLLYILYPIVMLLLEAAGIFSGNGSLTMGVFMIPFVIEIVVDMSVMAGLEKNDARQTKYLRYSPKGREFLVNALWGDTLRRVFTYFIPFLVAVIVLAKLGFSLSPIWGALFGYSIVELGILITRLFDSFTLSMCVSALTASLSMGCLNVIIVNVGKKVNEGSSVLDIVLLAVGLLVAVGIVVLRHKITLDKYDGGFHNA